MTVFTVHHAGEHTTERCHTCGWEVIYRGEPGPSARHAKWQHVCTPDEREPEGRK